METRFKTVEEVKDYLCEHGCEDTVVLEDYDYASAFVGITEDDRAVYDYDSMVEWLAEKEPTWELEDVEEWISDNTIRAIPYMGEKAPVILYGIGD